MLQIETRLALGTFPSGIGGRHGTTACRSRHRPLRTVVPESFQTDDHGHRLHTVVRRRAEAGAGLLAVRSARQHDPESSGPGIAERRAEYRSLRPDTGGKGPARGETVRRRHAYTSLSGRYPRSSNKSGDCEAATARRSQRSFSGISACPLTQTKRTL